MVLSYVDCKWIQLLRVQFGCTKSRVREILIDMYPNHGLQIHTPNDLISYASSMLGTNIEQQCEQRWESGVEECESKEEPLIGEKGIKKVPEQLAEEYVNQFNRDAEWSATDVEIAWYDGFCTRDEEVENLKRQIEQLSGNSN